MAVALTVAASSARAQKPVTRGAPVSGTFAIEAIDHATRAVILEDAQGETETVLRGADVDRFNAPGVTAAVPLRDHESTARAIQPSGSNAWSVDVIPFYFWAVSTAGDVSAGPRTRPFHLDFANAADALTGAFTFHVEARRGRWGVLSDFNLMKLSTEADFTVGRIPVSGDVDFDTSIFELAATYRLSEESPLAILGGIRTYTMSPKLSVASPNVSATPIDASETSANAIVGITFRPTLAERWRLISRVDVGGGSALTWSAELGAGVTFKPWFGMLFGYKGLGIDAEDDGAVVTEFDLVQHGPFLGLDFRWGGR